MTVNPETHELENLLESMIDKHGIEQVLNSIGEICGHKAEHVAVNWQDANLAKSWAALKGALAKVIVKAGRL